MFEALSQEDLEYAVIDATNVYVHRHGPGAKGRLLVRLSVAQRVA